MPPEKESSFDLLTAARKGEATAIAFYLAINQRADLNIRDKGGHTPLMLAALGGHKETVLVLLKNGAHPLARNHEKKNVLELVIPVYNAVQREIVGHALDGINTDAGTEKSIRWSHILSSLQEADKAARDKAVNFSTPERKAIRPLRPLHFKK